MMTVAMHAHQSGYQSNHMLLMFLQEGWVPGLHPQCWQQGVLVRERIPTQGDDGQKQALRGSSRLLRGWSKGEESVLDWVPQQ